MNDPQADRTELSNTPGVNDEFPLGSPTDEAEQPGLSGDRDPLDRLAEEFVARCRRGETPTIAEYEAQWPDQAEQVRKLLSAVATMEQLRRGSRQARFLPERIGEFRVLRELGRGGMGVVYEAVQESLWRHVAVKEIHHSQLDSKRLQRFQREAQAVAQLHHTNIVPIFGVGEHDGVPYYAMQYIKGRGLDAVLESWRSGQPSRIADHWRIAARYTMQTAEALGYAHEQGVLHRDVKPANLLIDEQDAVWITDFGLAKMVGHEDLTASGDVIGTLRYLAPESLRGISEGRSDVYSLGMTLYEMLTLTPPFGLLSPSELLHKVSDGQPIRPRHLDPTIPRDLETIVLKATARDLKDRYPTAKALASDLECFLHDRPIQARRATIVERAWRWSRRNRLTAVFVALAAASVTAAAIVGWAGYAYSYILWEKERTTRVKRDQYFAIFSEFLPDLLDLLVPEDLGEDNREVLPLTQPLAHEGDGNGSTRVFADRADGPGPESGPGPGREPAPSFGALVNRPEPGPGPRRGPNSPFGKHADRPGPRRRPPGDQGLDAGRDSLKPFDDFAGGPPPPLAGMMPPGGPLPELENLLGMSLLDQSRTLALLKRVLASYDQFAQSQQDKTDASLQTRAAWVYFKLGTLNERLGHRQEADAAFDRSLQIFDELTQQHPREPAYFQKFFKVCAAINPWQQDPAIRSAVEGRLKSTEQSLSRLLAVAPANRDYLRTRMQLLAKLGLIRQAQERSDAIEPLRQALEIAGKLIDRQPEEGYPHSDRSDVLEAFGLVLADQGQVEAARQRFESAFEDLEWVAADGLKSEPLATRIESLADDFERLGDATRSDQIQQRADEIDPRPPNSDRPKPRRPFAPRRDDSGPAPSASVPE